ncbi:MAG TPA: hypothetical protein VL309_05630 [Vicinamibacterales bacterium]|jgi:hypothetical protein|nr:hypothetical protein [Vicinamibacterales bacterium]
MPWRCPACHSSIRHSEHEEKPRRGAIYRCHICRLELMLDEKGERLTVTPVERAVEEALLPDRHKP